MLNYINGYSYPIFKVYAPEGSRLPQLIESIELPLTNQSGLIETLVERKAAHELLSYSVTQKIYGYTITWTLPYDEYANVDTMEKIQKLIRYQKANYTIYLIPRADVRRRKFEVYMSSEELSHGVRRGGINSIGNRLVEMKWTTKHLVSDPNWFNPNNILYASWYRFAVLTT